MIIVDESETFAEVYLVAEYLKEFADEYSTAEISFAKEHAEKKVSELMKQAELDLQTKRALK